MLPVQGSGWVAVVGDDGVQRRRSCRIFELGEYGQALLNVSCAPKGPWVRRWFRTRRWGRRSGTSPGIRSCWGQYPARGSSGVAAGTFSSRPVERTQQRLVQRARSSCGPRRPAEHHDPGVPGHLRGRRARRGGRTVKRSLQCLFPFVGVRVILPLGRDRCNTRPTSSTPCWRVWADQGKPSRSGVRVDDRMVIPGEWPALAGIGFDGVHRFSWVRRVWRGPGKGDGTRPLLPTSHAIRRFLPLLFISRGGAPVPSRVGARSAGTCRGLRSARPGRAPPDSSRAGS